MGRIVDLLPGMYHAADNELVPFLRELEPTIQQIEKKIDDFPSLSDVDRCPEEYLPYLAALTNVPLVGEDPRLWRRQIRNWPWLLKIKGTEESLAVFLQSIGASSYTLHTWFRDATGNLVEEKPKGEPFFSQASGNWHNIRTHYFSIDMVLDEQFVSLYKWSQEDLVNKVLPWLERTKPFHAELLSINIVPPDGDMGDHACRHDYCNWSHGYLWARDIKTKGIAEILRILPGLVDSGYLIRCFGHAAYSWSAIYDAHRFGDLPHSPIDGGLTMRFMDVVRFADGAHNNHKWHRSRSWKCGGTWQEDCCLREIVGDILVTSRSTAVFGGYEPAGSINACFSGGVELVVPHMGFFGVDEYSMRELRGGRFVPISEFTEYAEIHAVEEGFFERPVAGGVETIE